MDVERALTGHLNMAEVALKHLDRLDLLLMPGTIQVLLHLSPRPGMHVTDFAVQLLHLLLIAVEMTNTAKCKIYFHFKFDKETNLSLALLLLS